MSAFFLTGAVQTLVDNCITGITADGREVPIFVNGDWAE